MVMTLLFILPHQKTTFLFAKGNKHHPVPDLLLVAWCPAGIFQENKQRNKETKKQTES